MSDATRFFSDSYALARKRFRDAAKAADAPLTEVQHTTANGPRDEPLYTDVAVLGASPAQARTQIFITSGVHGIEGFCGSAIQTGLMREGLHETLPEGMSLVLIHAVNPFGFAHLRRVNEDNVDINRNFLAHDAPYPDDAAYGEIHGFVAPPDLPSRKGEYDAIGFAHVEAHGYETFKDAVSSGQWTHADGLFYGGRAPAWSNRTVRALQDEFLGPAQRIAHLDVHTGLGEFAHEELITFPVHPGGTERAREWYEHVTALAEEDCVSSPVRGDIGNIWNDMSCEREVTFSTLEFGTREALTVLDALRLDNWLHLHGAPDGPDAGAIKQLIRDAFYPQDADWQRTVFERALTVFRQTVAGLSA